MAFLKSIFGSKNKDNEQFYSPLKGKVVALTSVKDQAFASLALGNGVAIIPSEGRVVAPLDCKVAAMFPTKHAIGLRLENGAEILIHIGMDTVKLEGKYFLSHVQVEESVKKGQLLIEFDRSKLQEEGYDLTTPVVVTNGDDYIITETQQDEVSCDDVIFTLTLKK